ncbi:MAG: transposase [Elusimicrobia bacterium]|nr:transposase [Elusimicrobiota bacterium]
MKRKSPTRHSPEKIKNALAKLEAGKPLTEIAKDLGVSKSLVSYWRDHATQIMPQEGQRSSRSKQDTRSRKFIAHCWQSIGLAFKKLDMELKADKPQGIRDLALAIAVLIDKLNQAAQNLKAQAAPGAASAWSMSEDTLLILRQHREANPGEPPEKKIAEAGLEASDLEQQKRAKGGEANQSEIIPTEAKKAQPGAPGVD